MAAPASAASFLTASDLQADFEGLPHDERGAWRELASAWGLGLDDGDPCAAAQRLQVQCFRTANSTLALIRQLDRPGILTLRDSKDRSVYALLTGLSDDAATLRFGTASRTVSLLSLATLWRGEFATFWRAPPEYTGKLVEASSGASAGWVSAQLAKLHHEPPVTTDVAWKAQVSAFQLSQGLKPDGLAGPTTFMQLNRALGIDEPRLRAAAAH
jgi:general secretion pathway protein A